MQISESEFEKLFLEAVDMETDEPIIKLRGAAALIMHELKIDMDKFTDAMVTLTSQIDKNLDISSMNDYLPTKISFFDIIFGKFNNNYFDSYKPLTVAEASSMIYHANI